VRVGILALQGDVAEHAVALRESGAHTQTVRRPADLVGLDGIVLPGGESTTLSLLLESSGLWAPLAAQLADGLPVFGTCAGLVLLANEVFDGRPDQRSFCRLDCVVRRNGYGRQAESFESELDAPKLAAALGEEDRPLPAVFIRAPVIESAGPRAEVLATLAGAHGERWPVACRQGPVLATSFHPELTADRRLHRLFVDEVAS
jgi:pyridoxal 5'-phosphate synthase pdxT subunit